MSELIVEQVRRLCLLTDAHKARKRHQPTADITKRLLATTARIAAQHGPNTDAQRTGCNHSHTKGQL